MAPTLHVAGDVACPDAAAAAYVCPGTRTPYVTHLLTPHPSPQHLLVVNDAPELLILDKTRLGAPPVHAIHPEHTITAVRNVFDAGAAWAAASEGGYCALWDARVAQATAPVTMRGPQRAPYVSLATQGALVAAGTELKGAEAYLDIWDIRRPDAPIVTYTDLHSDDVTTLAFHPDAERHGGVLLSGGMDGLLSAVDTTQLQEEEAVIAVGNTNSSLARIGWAHAASAYKSPAVPYTDDLDDVELALARDPRRAGLGPVYAVSNMQTFGMWDADKFDELLADVDVRLITAFRPSWATDYVVDAGAALGVGIPLSATGVPMFMGDQAYVAAAQSVADASGGAALVTVAEDAGQATWTLHARLPSSASSARAHSDIVRCVDRDAQYLYTGGEDGTVLAWTLAAQAAPVGPLGAMSSSPRKVHSTSVRGRTAAGTQAAVPELDGKPMEQLSDLVFLHKPENLEQLPPPAPCSPSIVLIHGWMDTPISYVNKYAIEYAKRFPHARILVHLSTTRSAFRSNDAKFAKAAVPVVQAMQEAGDAAAARLPNIRPTAITHTFSNGGLTSLVALLRFAGKQSSPTFPSPLASVFDSAPGETDPVVFANASTFGMERQRMGKLKKPFLYGFLWTYQSVQDVFNYVFGRLDFISQLRAFANTPSLWHWLEDEQPQCVLPPRLYAFSLADPFIPAKSVEKHARDAQDLTNTEPLPLVQPQRGEKLVWPSLEDVQMRLLRYDTAPHCAMMRVDKEGYWNAVDQFIQDAIALRGQDRGMAKL
ncbi:hypothetical protein MSPP1_000705 [Malassezia sp. CBS 17886]|nr:hypothetical protein MSPP1_000705 [Malassezia sp. CBS 17886]